MNFAKKNQYPVFIDSDTGPDDGIAIMVAAANFKERIAMCLSIFGNLTLDATTQNFKTATEIFQISKPIYRGAEKPLCDDVPFVTEKDITFIRQYDVFPQGENQVIDVVGFVDLLYSELKRHKKSDYIALGPLTNLAQLLKKYPDAPQYINCVVIMGGGLDLANITPYAEYNMYCDAQSAQTVFASDLEIHVVALNATNPTAYSVEQLATIAPENDLVSTCVNRMIDIEEELTVAYGNTPGIIYDAIAMAYYVCPEYFETEQMGLSCVTQGKRYGQTVRDDSRRNIYFVKNPNKEKILGLLQDSVKKCRR